MAIISPVSHSQPSESRKAARFCNSSMRPTRPIGLAPLVSALLLARVQPLAHALGRDLARRDRVEPDSMVPPFGSER